MQGKLLQISFTLTLGKRMGGIMELIPTSEFSLHCKHHNITPVSLHLSSSVKGSKADNILRRAERSLLNVRIGQVVQKLKHLDNEKDRLGDLIFRASPLSADDKAEVKQRVTKSEVKEHDTCKQRQQRKFTRLVEKKEQQDKRKFNNNIAADCISKWVKNCSQRILSDPELHVLARGLNFAVTEDEVPIVEFITATESACRNLPETQANELRSKVVNLVSKPKKIDSNISKDERKALQDLRKDQSIRILPADKGRLCVILDTTEYHQKCEALLGDTNTYKKLGKRDPTSRYKKNLVSVLQDIENEGAINRVEYRKLYPTAENSLSFMDYPRCTN
ncbi:uncharacterized protein [Amphiura filiformis]|uniref:uncharacterized protein n=1 Tax=Amphiura filiformis TaxID=82378 RepID=UPI003B20D997